MNVLELIACSIVAAALAWAVTLAVSTAALARSRAAMHEEIRHWQAETARARARAAQLADEITTWSKGCQQGREDVIAIMPLLLAAQERLAPGRTAPETDAIA
jgi:post-segregation antitoxin (ccd killing protein)